MSEILVAGLVIGGIGLVLGCVIGLAVLFFAVKSDNRVEMISGVLPGANCGGCGFAGCGDFARAIVENGVEPTLCVACNDAIIKEIGSILGKEFAAKEKKVAVVYCSGDRQRAIHCAEYNGLSDCRAAAAYAGGGKGCRYGCVGMGSCARNCPFGAIEMRNGLAIVHPDLCVGCGKCTEICPRKLIHLVPAGSKGHIYCNSLDKPAVKRKVCKAGCIGCKKCVKAFPGLFNAAGGLVRVVEPEKLTGEVLEKTGCPVHVLRLVQEDLSSLPSNKQNTETPKEKNI